jgi:TolC family type I secretion outer membrane protein
MENRWQMLCAGLATAIFLSFGASQASAESLQEALAQAYATNPALQAQMAAVRAAHERVPEARAGFLPSLFADIEAGKVKEESTGGLFARDETRTPVSTGLTLDQPVYQGGRTVAAVSRAEFEALAQQAVFRQAEQGLLRDAASSYVDVTLAEAVLELTRKNEDVLARQLQSVRDRLEAGDVTITDLSQAEARLAGASARRRQAEGDLTAARTAYRRIIGIAPSGLESPVLPAVLPDTLDSALDSAMQNNPAIKASVLLERAAQAGIDLAEGGLLPALNLQAGISSADESSARDSETDLASAVLRLSVPLYQGGGQYARVRQAKELQSQRLLESRDVSRLIEEDTIQAWEALQTARANIESFESQVRAAEAALRGVRDEEQAGTRTILDVLDAEQELLDAQVELVRAQRNAFVAALDLRVAAGTLTADALGLPVDRYDIEAHYRKTHNRWFGTGTDGRE